MLGGLPHEFQDKQSITAWLTKQPPEKLSSGLFKVPRQHQRPEGYAQLLTALGFQLVELKVDSQKNKVLKKVTPGKAGKAAQWMQPWHLVRLRLNTVALQQVLHAGTSLLWLCQCSAWHAMQIQSAMSYVGRIQP